MKHWMALAALLFGSSLAAAAVQTYDVGCDTVTSFTTSVTSYTTAGSTYQLFTAAVSGLTTSYPLIMPQRTWLELTNVDTSSNAVCAIDVNTSTTPANWVTFTSHAGLSTTNGKILNPGIPWRIAIPPFQGRTGYPVIPTCISASNGAGGKNVNISLTQCGSY